MSTSLYYSGASSSKTFNPDSNSAGAPLPFIPRRHIRSHVSAASVFPYPLERSVSAPTLPVNDNNDSASSSSSSSDSLIVFEVDKANRSRSADTTPPKLMPADLSTERSQRPDTKTAEKHAQSSTRPERRTSRSLRLDMTPVKTPEPEPVAIPFPTSSLPPAPRPRKKSGELVKSSLKIKPAPARGDLSVVTGAPLLNAKSEPTTPTHSRSKSVQFAEQLEKVKLFLAEQKPLAVSRDGSPTDDTSATESDFPSFIYGFPEQERKKKNLVLHLVNKPQTLPVVSPDVILEDVSLADSVIQGHVKVRNLAFQKWLAVRFTFDWWQTTSEVAAKYESSLPGGQFDRFSFSIRIQEMLSKIEEKTMFLAVRYTVAGREIWDNNGGKNYQLRFSVASHPPSIDSHLPGHDSDSDGLSRLKNKLERLAQENESSGSSSSRRRSHSEKVDRFDFNSTKSLSSRYTFSTSLKQPWKPAEKSHSRSSTHPNSNSVAWPQQGHGVGKVKKPYLPKYTRGSPRLDGDNDSTVSRPYIHDQDVDVVDESQFSVDVLRKQPGLRNHRRTYFDGPSPSMGSAVKLTPPGSPPNLISETAAMIQKNYAYALSSPGIKNRIESGSSDGSTTSITSGSSDEVTTPPFSPRSNPIALGGSDPQPNPDLSTFLDKFCFFTGNPNKNLDVPIEAIQRSHSASSVEDFLYGSPANATLGDTTIYTRQLRSSSFDDVASLASGGSTPTPTNSATPSIKATVAF